MTDPAGYPPLSEQEQRKRKQTLERAKANYLSGQLRLRLQYAKLKVEHGWQRQNLNEVENLYFRHSHLRQLQNPRSSPSLPPPSRNQQQQSQNSRPPSSLSRGSNPDVTSTVLLASNPTVAAAGINDTYRAAIEASRAAIANGNGNGNSGTGTSQAGRSPSSQATSNGTHTGPVDVSMSDAGPSSSQTPVQTDSPQIDPSSIEPPTPAPSKAKRTRTRNPSTRGTGRGGRKSKANQQEGSTTNNDESTSATNSMPPPSTIPSISPPPSTLSSLDLPITSSTTPYSLGRSFTLPSSTGFGGSPFGNSGSGGGGGGGGSELTYDSFWSSHTSAYRNMLPPGISSFNTSGTSSSSAGTAISSYGASSSLNRTGSS
ncbi:hypothetical protein C8Q75DRAFT_524176 [Abortiporus biennis]|nr:hypothetical protein C8Q75DRAFT_524176 [Abortiporus biennis]